MISQKKNTGDIVFVEKTYSIRKVWGVSAQVSQGSEKKVVSVGLFSTFRHPLALLVGLY